MSTEPATRPEAAPRGRWWDRFDQWHREHAQRVLAVIAVVAMAALAWFWIPRMWDLREPCADAAPGQACEAPPAIVSWVGFFAGLVAIPTGLVTAVVLLRYAAQVKWWRFGRAAVAQFTTAMVAWAVLYVLGTVLATAR